MPAPSAARAAPDDREDLDLRRLASRSARLALLVEASSSRRDARRSRARLLLLLLSLACPRAGAPARAWYVPGAVARMSKEAIGRAWEVAWGRPPCARTLRRHLAALGDLLAIVLEPGQRLERLRSPGRAPRHPDTVHVLDDEQEALWWERTGAEVLRRHPELRRSPEAWRARLGQWRALARSRQLDLFDEPRAPIPMPGREAPPDSPAACARASRLVAQGLRDGPMELLEALGAAGAHVPPAARVDALRAPSRLARAAAMYALALARGDRVRDGWAWVRFALHRAHAAEGAMALERLGLHSVLLSETATGGGDAWRREREPPRRRLGYESPPGVLPDCDSRTCPRGLRR